MFSLTPRSGRLLDFASSVEFPWRSGEGVFQARPVGLNTRPSRTTRQSVFDTLFRIACLHTKPKRRNSLALLHLKLTHPRLTLALLFGSDFSRQLCYDHCSSKGAAFMATQYSFECFCSADVDLDYKRHGDGAVCDMACLGDEVGAPRASGFGEQDRGSGVDIDHACARDEQQIKGSLCRRSTRRTNDLARRVSVTVL